MSTPQFIVILVFVVLAFALLKEPLKRYVGSHSNVHRTPGKPTDTPNLEGNFDAKVPETGDHVFHSRQWGAFSGTIGVKA
jgi:hypothetical protein